jgi:hypothetical protein
MAQNRRRIAVGVMLLVAIVSFVVILAPKKAAAALFDPTPVTPATSDTELTLVHEAVPPAPEEDTCQHCHLAGSIENIWTPAWRWLVFSVMGVVFVYGSYRMGSAWVTRRPWIPLTTRAAEWIDERFHIIEPLRKMLSKPVPIFATRWMYCLGGITFMLLAIQGITGVLLAMYYKPTPDEAYASIQFIENEVRFGSAIRAIHHWAANGTIIMVVAHLLRVFITGAFKPPRELNWVTGIFLFVLTLGFGFTGYLLPWDQRAFWATTVGTEIGGGLPQIGDLALVFLRGGWDVTAVTLSRFFAVHVLVLPAMIVILLAGHFWMIRRQGIARPL